MNIAIFPPLLHYPINHQKPNSNIEIDSKIPPLSNASKPKSHLCQHRSKYPPLKLFPDMGPALTYVFPAADDKIPRSTNQRDTQDAGEEERELTSARAQGREPSRPTL